VRNGMSTAKLADARVLATTTTTGAACNNRARNSNDDDDDDEPSVAGLWPKPNYKKEQRQSETGSNEQ